ncbi:MAG: energy-coupling factor transporter transmembrane protein EcfT [Lachnospiraceae bacterium]|nr:energy-coupling factor transporter transmembrane protein EcfT [Lachnospiraceae bacterium]
MRNIFNYVDRESPIHRLTGASKFVCLILWSTASMITYDTRLLAAMPVLGLIFFAVSKIRLKDVSFMVGFTSVFLSFNLILMYLFAPDHGTTIYGTRTVLFGKTRFAVTAEQLFYMLNYALKFISFIPVVLLFVCTTNPSEFASSLNKLGIPVSISYSVALALRYIPDIQREYREISQAQQARGVELSRKVNIIRRLKGAAAILIPLVMSSMERIETISNAMILRSFGLKKKRTWYMGRAFKAGDFLAMIFCALLVAAAVVLNVVNGGRFWNPFV